jgi:hypothetical protein
VKRGTKKTGWRKCSTNVLDRRARCYALVAIVLMRTICDSIRLREVDVLFDVVRYSVIFGTEVVLYSVHSILCSPGFMRNSCIRWSSQINANSAPGSVTWAYADGG